MRIAIIVLAAGASKRFGPANKLLAHADGEPMILGVARRLSAVRVPGADLDLVAVTLDADGAVARCFIDMPEALRPRIVVNPRASRGMGTSIAAGIAALGPEFAAAMVVPGDMPRFSTEIAQRLISAFVAAGGMRVTHPVLEGGRKTGPAVWPRGRFGELLALDGSSGGQRLLESGETAGVPFDASAAALLADVDTPDDLAKLAELSRAVPGSRP